MKSMKKYIAVLLALVMIFAVTIAPSAAKSDAAPAEADTVTLRFILTDGTEVYPDITYTIPSGGATVYDAINAYADTLEPVWKEVPNVNPDVPGDTAFALESLFEVENQAGNGPTSGVKALAWSTNAPAYGLMSYRIEDDVTTCDYVYVGESWEYSVNGDVPENLYMDQYHLSAGDVVVLSYGDRETYWTANSEGLGGGLLNSTYPYLP